MCVRLVWNGKYQLSKLDPKVLPLVVIRRNLDIVVGVV